MTTATLTLSEFLLARLAEDEEAARAASPGPWFVPAPNGLWPKGPIVCENHWPGLTEEEAEEYGEAPGPPHYVICQALHGGTRDADVAHIARHDPARVLAEVDAKRRIVEHFEHLLQPGEPDISPEYDDGYIDAMEYAIKLLALPYSSHADYREEWRI